MKETITLPKPVLGINNVAEETDLPEGSVREAINVDINNSGDVTRKKGHTLVYTGINIHSYFQKYFVENGTFKKLNDDYTATALFSGLNVKKELSYAFNNNELFFTNGDENYKSDGTFLGIECPPGQPILSPSDGQLIAGTYQVAICFINVDTMELSGTGLATSITVADNSGILLSNIAQAIGDFGCAIFVSNVNGEGLYYQTTIAKGLNSYVVSSLNKGGKLLDTQHLSRLPPGQILRFYKGKAYVANDNVLYFSESMRFGLCRLAKNYFNFPSRITILEPVDDGLFVIADKTYFISGTNADGVTLTTVSQDTGVEGTGLSVKGSYFNIESEKDIAYWFSNKGATIGMSGGSIKNLTEGRLSVSVGDKGISDYRELAGIRQVVSRLNKKSTEGNFRASDYATGEIIRNGVLIN